MRTPRIRTRSKLLTLLAAITVIGSLAVAPAVLAVHDDGLFELDKDAQDGKVSMMGGWLASTVSATATSINVCRPTSPATTLAAVNEILRIRQETMVVTSVTNP